jgi:proline iminopeptidase
MKHYLTFILFLLFVLAVQGQDKDSFYFKKIADPATSFIQLKEGYKIFSQKYGTGKIQILFLHGGPGNTHEYFDIFKDKLPLDKFQLIFFDQLGSYYSDQPKDTTLWNLERCINEVEQVREFYKLDKFYLLGHSWGGLLAMEYAVKYPNHLKGLIISNRGYSQKKMQNYIYTRYKIIANGLKLSEKTLSQIKDGKQITDSLELTKILATYRKENVIRLDTLPEPMARNAKHLTKKYMPYYHFRSSWDFSDSLSLIKAPTLLISSKYDQVEKEDILLMVKKIKNSDYYICPKGSHFAFWDDTENYFKALNKFFLKTEKTLR